VKGAVRSVLASADIESILESRSTFGDAFTKEVEPQLKNWGVAAVKNLELMDIRDLGDNKVIHNIMAKKKSHIEMESRTEVAKNHKLAEIAEIEAKREVDIQAQQAEQAVGLRTVESKQQVALSQQAMTQLVKEQEKTTKEKEMAVTKVQQVRAAEIEKEVRLVKAAQDAQAQIIVAEGQKSTSILAAEGQLESKKREAEGISLEGNARADAEKAMQLAPVQAQITLAKEIGSNESYQKYLITIRRVEADQAVGMAQAHALEKADVKVIANTGNPTSGVKTVMDLFNSKGGTELGGMLEGLSQTPAGQALIGKVLGTTATETPNKPLANGKH
jgi:flotillin